MIDSVLYKGAAHRSISLTVRDPLSALTHFIGIIYSLILMPLIICRAIISNSDAHVTASIVVFMTSMILLYLASTLYHTFGVGAQYIPMLKKLDHCMIFVLIAGSYTPVCLISIRHLGGIPLLLFVWFFAIVGIIFKLRFVTCPKWVSSTIYITMGWLCVFALPSLYRTMPHYCFAYLLLGGLLYTIGGIIYALKPKAINNKLRDFGPHEIFHVFVMLGTLAHFICIWLLI